ncbi:MAG: hypothetical protein Q9220_000294 [cf. Caloplaca sp. 1 TL-2023]
MSHRERGSGRSEREREKERYEERRREPRESVRERDLPSSSRGASLNEFFVDGEGINREVMQRELCKYLGPDALSRPGTYNGQKGYIVTAVRPFTSKMIEDLKATSQDYERERREMNSRGYKGSPMRVSPSASLPNHSLDVPYANSRTKERQDGVGDPYAEDMRYPSSSRYPEKYPEMYPEKYASEKYTDMYPSEKYQEGRVPPGYIMPSGYASGPNYSPSQAPGYPSGTGYPASSSYPAHSYPQGPNYPPTSAYPPSSGYVTSGYPSTSAMPGSRNEPNYIYTDPPGDYGSSSYSYQQPGVYSSASQANPRATSGYPYVSSAQDPSLRGMAMDEREYNLYSQQMMPGQPGRSAYPAPARGTPTQYDPPQPREGFPPQPREPFGTSRADPPRDERRRR